MIYGQKVIKIFNHEDETLNGFNEVNETSLMIQKMQIHMRIS